MKIRRDILVTATSTFFPNTAMLRKKILSTRTTLRPVLPVAESAAKNNRNRTLRRTVFAVDF